MSGRQADHVEGDAFLSKPFAPNELLTIVEDSLNSAPFLCRSGAFETNRIPAPLNLAALPQ